MLSVLALLSSSTPKNNFARSIERAVGGSEKGTSVTVLGLIHPSHPICSGREIREKDQCNLRISTDSSCPQLQYDHLLAARISTVCLALSDLVSHL